VLKTPEALLDSIAALDPRPRDARWASLTSCVIDAVWSIGAHYDNVVVPLTRSVFSQSAPADDPLLRGAERRADPVPVDHFLMRFPTPDALLSATNGQRTSTRSGITKAEAAHRHVRAFRDSGILTRDDAVDLLRSDGEPLAELERVLAMVPGEGSSGVRRGYLWMLVGDDDAIKPDRMVLRWLRARDVRVSPQEARALLTGAAADLSARLRRPITPWMVDHAIWRDARSR